MDTETRSAMLKKAITQLKERYPDETNDWIQQRAELLVEQKLGQGSPTKPTRSEEHSPPPSFETPTEPAGNTPQSDAANRPSLAGPAMISTAIVFLALAVLYAGNQAGKPRVLEMSGISAELDDGTKWYWDREKGWEIKSSSPTPIP